MPVTTSPARTIDAAGIDRSPYGHSDPHCAPAVGCPGCAGFHTVTRVAYTATSDAVRRDLLAAAARTAPYGYAPAAVAVTFDESNHCAAARRYLATVSATHVAHAIRYAERGHRGRIDRNADALPVAGPCDVARASITLRLAALAAATPGLSSVAAGTP